MVLLEAVLAMALFALSAGMLLSSMSASSQALVRARHQTHAADLAHSVLAMLEAGVIAPVDLIDAGPTSAFSPSDEWTCEVVSSELELDDLEGSLVQLTVTVTHTPSGYVQRLVQWLPRDVTAAVEGESSMELDAGGLE